MVPGVSITSPPKTALFAPFHHTVPGAAAIVKNTRVDRRPILNAPADTTSANNAVQPQFIIVPQYGQSSPRRKRTHHSSSSDAPLSLSDEDTEYPTVGDWLETLKDKPKAHIQDFEAIRGKFGAQKFLEMSIEDLSRVPREELRNGYHFLGAEIVFLTKWLEKAVGSLRGHSKHKRKKYRHD